MTSIAIINQSPPYGHGNGQESLDLALAGGSFGQTVALFFLGDGVLQLKKGQDPDVIEHRNYSKTFAALEFYDIEEIMVCENSLVLRGLSTDDLCVDVRTFKEEQLNGLLERYNHVVMF